MGQVAVGFRDTLRIAQGLLDECEDGPLDPALYEGHLRLIQVCLNNADLRQQDTRQERQRLKLLEIHKEDM